MFQDSLMQLHKQHGLSVSDIVIILLIAGEHPQSMKEDIALELRHSGITF